MRELMNMDTHDYDETLEELYRVAIRGVIIKNKQILVVEAFKYNEYKLPGGGIENNEDDSTTLIREVHEETGYRVIKESIKPYGYVDEKRMSYKEQMIWHQLNRYYLCDVEDEHDEPTYTEHELKVGFCPRWVSIDEAIAKNEAMLANEGQKSWNQREYLVFKAIKTDLKL